MKNTVATIYNPHNQSKQQLINSFVVRLKIFKRLFRELKDTKMETPEQPLLVVGQRGMGKTTLLLRLGYEIENDAALKDWMIPIVFAEEQYGVNELYALWEQTAKELGDKDSTFEGLEAKMDELYVEDALGYEQICFEILTKELQKVGKKLVLFIDNLGVLLQRFSSLEQHRLRERLLKSSDIRIVGASSVVLESSFDYGDALYNFFKESHLKGLNKEETKELLLKLGEVYGEKSIQEIVEKHIGRVEALRRITGGVIRTMVLLFEIFVDSEGGRAFRDLERVIDLTTPLYKHRMDDLSTQQQKIVAAIALHWDGISTKEIAQKTRLASKKIAAQLKVLQRNDLIQRIPTQTKNNLYQLSERFFNIWYLMRFGRKIGKERVLWLVRFFEEWCDVGMLKQRAERHIAALERGGYDGQSAYNVTLALAHTKHIDWDTQDRLLKETKMYLLGFDKELAEGLSDSDKELWEKAISFVSDEDWHKMEKYLFQIHRKTAVVYYFLGLMNYEFRNYLEAIENYDKAIELNPNYAEAYYNRGNAYSDLKEHQKALKNYDKAIRLNPNNISFFIKRGVTYSDLKDHSKALENYNKAIELNPSDYIAYVGRGTTYYDLKNYPKALENYNKSIELNPNNSYHYFFRGNAYNALEDYPKALENYNKSIELNPKDENTYNGRGNTYFDLKDYGKALKNYDKATELNPSYATAYYNKGNVYSDSKDYTKALENYDKAIELNPSYATAYYNRGNVYSDLKDYTKATQSYKQTFDLGIGYNLKNLENRSYLIGNALTFFLAQKEYTFLLQYFQNEKAQKLHLKDRFKPIYYALMHFLKDKYPTEYLRMPPEMKETVEEIIAKVEQMRVDYA